MVMAQSVHILRAERREFHIVGAATNVTKAHQRWLSSRMSVASPSIPSARWCVFTEINTINSHSVETLSERLPGRVIILLQWAVGWQHQQQ